MFDEGVKGERLSVDVHISRLHGHSATASVQELRPSALRS
jgi:hypothetical protein